MAKNEARADTGKGPEPKYRLEELRKHRLKLFGAEDCTFDGATAELDEDGEYTVKEIKETIERWGKKEAK